MAYLLDSNVFIEGKNRYYGLDFCPAFWDWLRAENAAGHVFSIEKVGDELAAGGDELSAWAAARDASFFLPVQPGCSMHFARSAPGPPGNGMSQRPSPRFSRQRTTTSWGRR